MKSTSGFGTIGMIGVLLAVIIVGAIEVSLINNNKATEQQLLTDKLQIEEKAMMEKKAMEEKAMMETEIMAGDKKMERGQSGDQMETETDSMMKKDDSAMMQKAGSYTTYSDDSLTMAQKGRTILFFHASWCPTCKSADADIVKNALAIPAGVTILKTDYDKEAALKQKYGVTTQHTFVEVDSSGAMIQKWSGGNFAEIVAKL